MPIFCIVTALQVGMTVPVP